MTHRHKITDFTMIPEDRDADLSERFVTIGINDVSRLPVELVNRTERLVNHMLTDYDGKDDMQLGMYMEADTVEGKLSLNVYISYSADEDCLTAAEIIDRKNDDYAGIRKYFLTEVLGVAIRAAERIQECI